MKKIITLITTLILCGTVAFTTVVGTGCGNNDKKIFVCASDIPHAEVLNGIVKSELKKKGYTLEVKTLDWTMQNDAVANGDYDANYFQHVPYLETYNAQANTKLFASCKVHYEPLGIYYGKATVGTDVTKGTTFEICDDESNAIRAFQLLDAKGVISKTVEGDNYPISKDGEHLNIGTASTKWTNKAGTVNVTLIAENLLVSGMKDYDFALLPCNTAYKGNISSTQRAVVEDDLSQVVGKANVIAARLTDYKNDSVYRAKIDALTDVMLSEAVSNYFATKYLGSMTCDNTTQIDLRSQIQ